MTAKEYAFIKGNDVVNIVLFDEPTTELLNFFKEEHGIDDIILSDGAALVGFLWNGTVFIPPKPYASWTLNEEQGIWEAPIPKPEDGKSYTWDESEKDWKPVKIKPTTQPFESWIWDDEELTWKAPVPYPSDGLGYRWNEEAQSWVLVTDE